MIKKLNKKLASVLCTALALSLIATPAAKSTAATVKLNKKKLTMTVGDTQKLKITGSTKKATWKIASGSGKIKLKNKKKSTVVVVAKKKGSAKVTATVAKKKYTCKVTIKAKASTATASASPAASATPELYASIQKEKDSPDWLKKLPEATDTKTKQLFVVAAVETDRTTAYVTMHQRDDQGNWKQIISTPAFVGKNGLCADAAHVEGCGQTPIGTYKFNKAFGIADDPGCALPYVKVTDDTYWSGDQNPGMHYNEMVDIKDYPKLDKGNSEHIIDYEYQYRYCLNISFNDNATPNKGSAIFLHCFGQEKPYTGGCVAVPEYVMKQIMQTVTADCVVKIDTWSKLGVKF